MKKVTLGGIERSVLLENCEVFKFETAKDIMRYKNIIRNELLTGKIIEMPNISVKEIGDFLEKNIDAEAVEHSFEDYDFNFLKKIVTLLKPMGWMRPFMEKLYNAFEIDFK